MCDKELLAKAGYGVYVKARKNRTTNKLMIAAEGDAYSELLQTLERLDIPYLQTYWLNNCLHVR